MRTRQRLLGLGVGLLPLLVPVARARAAGGAIYGVCGHAVWRVKAKTGAKRVLLRGDSSCPSRSPSVVAGLGAWRGASRAPAWARR